MNTCAPSPNQKLNPHHHPRSVCSSPTQVTIHSKNDPIIHSCIQHRSKKCAHSFIHSYTKVSPSRPSVSTLYITRDSEFFTLPNLPNVIVLGALFHFRYFACQYWIHSQATSSFVFVPISKLHMTRGTIAQKIWCCNR